MKVPTTFLRSKVARRIVYLFVWCALLPVTILAVVSFYEVSAQLREQSQRQLASASKSQGMAIYERLELLDDDLQVVSAMIAEHRSLEMGRTQQGHFIGMAAFSTDGRQVARWGNAISSPRLSEEEMRQAIVRLLRTTHNLAEGAGAAPLAAAWKLRQSLAGQKVVMVLSGGNIDLETLCWVLRQATA